MPISPLRPPIQKYWLGTVDQGRQFEFSAEVNGKTEALALIVADEKDDSLWFEIYVNGSIVQIPLQDIAQAIEAAQQGVHSEAWYEKNVYPNGNSDI